MEKILLVSHVGPGGGAGKYIQQLIDVLETEDLDLSVGGATFSAESGNYSFRKYFDIESICSYLVIYNGPSLLRKLYFFILLISKLNRNLCKNLRYKIFDTIVFTSSIQLLEAYKAARSNPNAKVVLVLQENINFNIITVSILKRISKRVKLISISTSWASTAISKNINVAVLENDFVTTPVTDVSSTIDYDLLYVGGDQKIKGFNFILDFMRRYKGPKKIKICLAGYYSEASLRSINMICNINVIPVIVGQVDSINSLLCKSKILLMPISKLHFCRPAIEAGLLGKTYIFPFFKDKDDFSYSNNCIKYKRGSIASFLSAISLALSDSYSTIEKLESNNKKHALEFINKKPFSHRLKSILNE